MMIVRRRHQFQCIPFLAALFAALSITFILNQGQFIAHAQAPITVTSTRSVTQAATINWQNGSWQGRGRASFTAPKIGQGTLVCRPDAQQIVFRPYDQSADTAMWITRIDSRNDGNSSVTVRAAKKTRYSGPEFNEGLNLTSGAKSGNGSFLGIISSQLNRDSAGGAGPPPTTFRISFYWQFAGKQSRCYIAATFLTERS